jgi:hypothetical protein
MFAVYFAKAAEEEEEEDHVNSEEEDDNEGNNEGYHIFISKLWHKQTNTHTHILTIFPITFIFTELQSQLSLA